MSEAAPTLGRRERKKRAMRANILATATRLFSTNGYHETTVSEIADELDISNATFFNYFGSKEAILEELADEILVELEDLLEEVASAEGSVIALLEAHFDGDTKSDKPSREISRGLSVEVIRVVLASPESPKVLERVERSIATAVRASQQRGSVRSDLDAEHVARTAAQLVLGAVTAWTMSPKDSLEQRLRESLSFLRSTAETQRRNDSTSQSAVPTNA
ncbi:MAG: TetR/AcrR family transcriptional regulator [Polyangiaceae bacterium]|nr:TetR/AcrR family transcriptional regulator [Polyangiaceae bacterium]